MPFILSHSLKFQFSKRMRRQARLNRALRTKLRTQQAQSRMETQALLELFVEERIKFNSKCREVNALDSEIASLRGDLSNARRDIQESGQVKMGLHQKLEDATRIRLSYERENGLMHTDLFKARMDLHQSNSTIVENDLLIDARGRVIDNMEEEIRQLKKALNDAGLPLPGR